MLQAYLLTRVSVAAIRAAVSVWKRCVNANRVAPGVKAADALALAATSHALGG